MTQRENFQRKLVLESFQDKYGNGDFWELLDEQCPESQYGWTEYYCVLYPKYKVRVGQDNSYTEVIPFEGIDQSLIRQRIIEALTDASDSQLLDVARSLGVKLV